MPIKDQPVKLCSRFLILPLSLCAAPLAAQAAAPRHRSPLQVAAYSIGGALIGGWSGYVASQVTWSDWQNGAGRRAQRIRFSVIGAGVGLLAGTLIGGRHTQASPAPPWRSPAAPPVSSRPITAEEIRASSARTVTDLVRQLRPQWLRSRGDDMVHANADPVAVHGRRVYLNGSLLGGMDALDQVSVYALTGIELYDTAAAVLRWGAGNEDGAILLSTQPAP